MNINNEAEVFRRYLTQKEQLNLLGTIKQYSSEIARRDFAVCALLISSGMRIGECLRISVGDAAAALESGYLFIPKEYRKGEACDLSVTLTRSVRAALGELLALRSGDDPALDEALIISRKSRARGWRALSIRCFELRLAHWARQAGLPDGVSPHWLRHTHAKNIMRNSTASDPLRLAQISLGQRSRRSTEIYTRPDREEVDAGLREVDGKVHGKPRLRLGGMRREYEGRAGV